jgi:L-alanine-DL-glutamate epimerase-like enolase superfamily enzyme
MGQPVTVGETYALLAPLPLEIESYSLQALSAPMAQRTRHSTVIHLHGGGEEGLGEDATPTESEQLAFLQAEPTLALNGSWTIDSFSAHLDTLDLFPEPPQSDLLRSFRRWGFESAALDLALRQAGRSLADAVGRGCRPVTFVNSLRLSEPATVDPIRERLKLFPELRFKLDPAADWDAQLIADLAATNAVDTLDLKSQYPPGAPFTLGPDPELYRQLVDAFPAAWIEDPAITPETWEVLEPHADRITWDAPLHCIADIEQLIVRPKAVNIKPVRFGTLQTLLGVYDYCAGGGIAMYGGGFGELGPGRDHIQYLASLFHPDTPNDVAPSGYNLAALEPTLPTSPLPFVPAATGFRWR